MQRTQEEAAVLFGVRHFTLVRTKERIPSNLERCKLQD
jgi:hypothetical protein